MDMVSGQHVGILKKALLKMDVDKNLLVPA